MKKGNLSQKNSKKHVSNQKVKNMKTAISVLKFYNPLIISKRNALGTTKRHKAALA